MTDQSDFTSYFSKYLFKTALQCPVKLYYKANEYPENHEALPFIAHVRNNKRQFKAFARCFYPEGISINADSVDEAHRQTADLLDREEVTLFDAVFIHRSMLATMPVVKKKGGQVSLYSIQIKAFDPSKHRLVNTQGYIRSKWRDYLIDFTYQSYIIGQIYPEWNLTCWLVLPDKTACSKTGNLHELLKAIENGDTPPQQTPIHQEELLVNIDVTEHLENIRRGRAFEEGLFSEDSFGKVLQKFVKRYQSEEKYPVTLGYKCKSCEFRIEKSRVEAGERSGFRECWEQRLDSQNGKTDPDLVFDLIGPGTRTWIEEERYFQHQIKDSEIPSLERIEQKNSRIIEYHRQAMQIMKAKGMDIPLELIKPPLFKEIGRWEYPIHFLDFEAGNYTIPSHKDRKPYHLVVFQYSCHSLYRDGRLVHHQWLDKGKSYPNFELIRQLREVPDIERGTIVQYSNFERHVLKIIYKELIQEAGEVPLDGDLSDWIQAISRRQDSSSGIAPYLADLSRLVKNYYYNREMEDSLSIKDVLQSIMTISPFLKEEYSKPYQSSNFDPIIWWQSDDGKQAVNPYEIMHRQQASANVRRGTEAMVVYYKLLGKTLSDQERNECRDALLKYCELDTLAMVMIYQHWSSLMQRDAGRPIEFQADN